MDKIRKIIQIGAFTSESNEWTNDEGNVYVFFEDESIEPIVLSADEAYRVYESIAEEQGVNLEENVEALGDVIENTFADGTAELCDRNNEEELRRANEELERARQRAAELQREKGTGGNEPPVPPKGEEEEDYSDQLADPVVLKKDNWKRVVGGVLLGAVGVGAAGAGIHYLMNQSEKNVDIDDEKDIDIDFDLATFDQLMDAMENDDARKVASETAMNLVEGFNTATHKDGNFRLVEDGETYLDLSFEEALVLTTFANYSEPAELYEVLGSHDITSAEAQEILESARAKLITYYMNALEPSGLAEMFHNEEDRAFFQNFESEVLTFNASHTTSASDQVIRDVYYNYVLDGATNANNVSPMAKLLAFDAVYGGLHMVESASVEHTQFLEFHGMGAEEETKYYIENILGLDYSSLSEDQIKEYRENIIESGTELVKLMSTGETKTEDNSSKEENTAEISITDAVDGLGLCNAVNSELSEKIQALDTMEANKEASVGLQITTINTTISNSLREAGLDELADKVDASINAELSDELLSEIRSASKKAAETVANYENKMATINDVNRPTIDQIISAANKYTEQLENYAGHSKDIATLINNRRHVEEYHYTSDENGYIGEDENGIPIFDESVFDDMTEEEKDDFIKENGELIDEDTSSKTEEVTEEELTPEEKEEVEEQKAQIEAELALHNASENGKIAANEYVNSSNYSFSPSTVTNPANGEVYDLNSMSFANAVAYAHAFGGNVPSASDSQIQNAAEVAAENYLDGLSQDEKDAIARGMGTDWENAKAQLKDSYKSGYNSQMEKEISVAISVGEEMKKVTEEAIKDAEEANKNQEAVEETQPEQQPTEDKEEQPAPEQPEDNNNNDGITEGEEEVEQTPEQPEENTDNIEEQPAPAPAPEEEEYDPNIGEQFQEGEELIEDADGNAVEEVVSEEQSANDFEAAVQQAYEQVLAQEAAEAEMAQSEEKSLSR